MGYSIFEETMTEMPWTEIQDAIKKNAIVLLPTGVIEEHGPHMGLGVDIYQSYLISKYTKRILESKNIPTLIAPPFYWGINSITGSFPGSFTVRKETMEAILMDIFSSLKRWGFSQVFNFEIHGDANHYTTLLETIQQARQEIDIEAFTIVPENYAKRFNLSGTENHVLIMDTPPPIGQVPKYSGTLDIHAGALETSVMAEYFPNEVNINLTKTLKATEPSLINAVMWQRGGEITKRITPEGYFGNPADFDLCDARKYIGAYSEIAAELIQCFVEGRYKYTQIR